MKGILIIFFPCVWMFRVRMRGKGALIASQSATMHIRSHHVMCEPPNARSHWLAVDATSISLLVRFALPALCRPRRYEVNG